jgi:hypothetical protein
MLALKSRFDGYKLTLPKEFIPQEIEEKYSRILIKKRGFINVPIDFLNETIQAVNVLGFSNASVAQQQSFRGYPDHKPNRVKENNFMTPSTDYSYRSPNTILGLMDKTIVIKFKHTLGFLNYFILFESFNYYFSRDSKSNELPKYIEIDLFDETGSAYAKLRFLYPIIDAMDMIAFDNSKPTANSDYFTITLKYNNFEYIDLNDDFVYPDGEVKI